MPPARMSAKARRAGTEAADGILFATEHTSQDRYSAASPSSKGRAPGLPAPGGNTLLSLLPQGELRSLQASMSYVRLEPGKLLFDHGKIPYVYFPTSGVITKVVRMDSGNGVEAGMIGDEGMVPLCLFLNLDETPFRAVVQSEGGAWRLKSRQFKSLAAPGTVLHKVLLRFAASFMAQISQSAGCNRLHPVSRRYCRWLLMTQDRLHSDGFALKQELAAQMLGVRRMTLTPVAQKLQRAGLIRYRRGLITIVDRPGLEASACECYRRIRSVYDSMLRS